MFTPKTEYAKIAFETILFVVKTGNYRRMEETRISADLKLQAACFVTAENSQTGKLLESGSTRPKTKALYDEILLHATALVKEDTNSIPLKEEELPDMKVQVHVVSNLEESLDVSQIKPGKKGVWIEQGDATVYLLPQNTNQYKKGSEIVAALVKQTTIDETHPYKVYTFSVATYE